MVDEAKKTYNASLNVFEDELAASLASTGMSQLLGTLLKELEEVEPAVEKYSAMWMEPEVAMKRILNCDLSAML
ncbi:hypothetical protein PMIN06_003841 [Paraphaeosphaeria minitans]